MISYRELSDADLEAARRYWKGVQSDSRFSPMFRMRSDGELRAIYNERRRREQRTRRATPPPLPSKEPR